VARDPRHDILFEPLQVGPKVWRNRFHQVPHSTGFGSDRAGAQGRFRATRAEGGWACVNVEICSIDEEVDRQPVPWPATLWDDDDQANLAHVVAEVHAAGSLIGVELWHGGSSVDGSPSRIAPGGASGLPNDAYQLTTPYTMTRADIRRVLDRYRDAARRAVDAGFDVLYAYGAHGYLPSQFLSPFYNHRDDEYGGSLRNRARFWLEFLEVVREASDGRCAIAVRIGIDPDDHAGPGIDDVLGFVRMADDLVDLWDVNVSVIAQPWLDMRPSRFGPQGYQVELSGRVREATAKPIVGVSRLTDPDVMVRILESGVWDLIGGARPAIADPFLPVKIEEGRPEDIRECIGCNFCLLRVSGSNHIACTQNPTAGEEFRRGWHPERVPTADDTLATLDVLVVGAGAAGLECALTLARRGVRRLHLVDANAEPGGYAALAASLPDLGEWQRLVAHRVGALKRLRNVEIVTRKQLTAEDVLDYGAEIVVLATGAEWRLDGLGPIGHAPIPGLSAPVAVAPEAILRGAMTGPTVLVYDCEGYFMGAGIAERLARAGHAVTLATPFLSCSPILDKTFEGDRARRSLREAGVEIVAETELLAADGDAATLHRHGETTSRRFDTIVPVTARRSRAELEVVLRADPAALAAAGIVGLHAIGDGVAPRLLGEAVFDGHRLARELRGDGTAPRVPYERERRIRAVIAREA
jgi:dimethylamine/trimethylamine dehydrogenase